MSRLFRSIRRGGSGRRGGAIGVGYGRSSPPSQPAALSACGCMRRGDRVEQALNHAPRGLCTPDTIRCGSQYQVAKENIHADLARPDPGSRSTGRPG
jgi:hypothetical protein